MWVFFLTPFFSHALVLLYLLSLSFRSVLLTNAASTNFRGVPLSQFVLDDCMLEPMHYFEGGGRTPFFLSFFSPLVCLLSVFIAVPTLISLPASLQMVFSL